jgi:MYXO-CTERM domain-containing protein
VVDEALFRELLDTTVVQPVIHTQEIINSRPYMTRLYTTMSPDEMTVDPVFTFNPDLAPVSNVHTAQLYIQCDPSIYEYEAPWRIVLPQGGTLSGTGQYTTWPLSLDGSMPANFKIVQLSETGSGDVIENNSMPIAMDLVDSGGTYSAPTLSSPPSSDGMPIGGNYEPVVLPENSSASAEGGGCGCAVPGERGSSTTGFGAFLLGAGVAIRRLRRRARA